MTKQTTQPESFIDLDILDVYKDAEFNLESAVIRTENPDYSRRTYMQIFNELKNELKKKGYSPISIRENALLRLYSGIDSFVCQNPNWTKESMLFLPEGDIFITPENPGIEYLDKTALEEIISKSLKIKPNCGKSWERYKSYSIPANRLNEDSAASFLLKDMAKPYGEFLRDNQSENFSIDLTIGDLEGPKIIPITFGEFVKRPQPSSVKFYKFGSDINTNGTAYTLRGIRGQALDRDKFKKFARYLGFVHEEDVQKNLEQAMTALNTIKQL